MVYDQEHGTLRRTWNLLVGHLDVFDIDTTRLNVDLGCERGRTDDGEGSRIGFTEEVSDIECELVLLISFG